MGVLWKSKSTAFLTGFIPRSGATVPFWNRDNAIRYRGWLLGNVESIGEMEDWGL